MQFIANTNSSAVGPTGANAVEETPVGTQNTTKANTVNGFGWDELYSGGKATGWAGLSQPGPPSGHGFTYDGSLLTNMMLERSNQWFDQVNIYASGAATIDVLHRIWQYDSLAVAFTEYAEISYPNLSIGAGMNSFPQSGVLLPEMRFPGTRAYFYSDVWANIHNPANITLAIVQNQFSTYMQGPEPVAIYNHVDYVSLLAASLTPYAKYQPKPLPRVKSSDDVTHGLAEAPSCLFDAKFLPVTDSITVQMNYSGSDWPVLSLYRCNGNGINDLILRVADNQQYVVNRYGYLGWNYNEGNTHVLAVVRHTLPKVIDLNIKSIVP